jgi:hypothetical protein
MPGVAPVSLLTEGDWDTLISRIRKGDCTPFLGAGMSSEKIPMGGEMARKLATYPNIEYPMSDSDNLIKVAQYVALTIDASRPKEIVSEIVTEAGYPDFDKADEPHMALAGLPLPLYMTTNYDDFMYQALKKTAGKDPQYFINRWYAAGQTFDSNRSAATEVPDINPTISKPAVYYFHGHKDELNTMVLTEDDYLDFLVRISRDQDLIPPRIQQAIGGTCLLFMGYGLNDTNFRVIFRGLVERQKNAQKKSITVQIQPGDAKVASYLTEYFKQSGIRVYWGTAREFVNDLKQRWDADTARRNPPP